MGCLLFNSTAAATWDQANANCFIEEQASLLSLETEAQHEFVKMELAFLAEHEGQKNWWTSGTDKGREGRWYWASSVAPVDHFLWEDGQPDDGIAANCLALGYGHDYRANDNYCITEHYPICEKSPQ